MVKSHGKDLVKEGAVDLSVELFMGEFVRVL